MPQLDVIYEDNHLLVVNKPAGLPVMGGTGQTDTLFERARQYIKRRYAKPGQVYLGIVSRLDAAVSGVVVFARTSKAAARLNAQFRARQVEKTYWALVEGTFDHAREYVDWLAKDERGHRMRVVAPDWAGAQEARMVVRPLSVTSDGTLVEVRLVTGRKHQIRAQLSHHGHPILGDRKYDSRAPFLSGIALHSRSIGLMHPTRRERLEFVAPLPAAWHAFGVRA
jgi:23S rRNA pseudouridine1911/1915/1917 synthase